MCAIRINLSQTQFHKKSLFRGLERTLSGESRGNPQKGGTATPFPTSATPKKGSQ